MIIHIGKNEYRINNSFVSSSKNLLLRILRKVKEESNIRGVSEYYITFIIMMYVASSTILNELKAAVIRLFSVSCLYLFIRQLPKLTVQ